MKVFEHQELQLFQRSGRQTENTLTFLVDTVKQYEILNVRVEIGESRSRNSVRVAPASLLNFSRLLYC